MVEKKTPLDCLFTQIWDVVFRINGNPIILKQIKMKKIVKRVWEKRFKDNKVHEKK